MKATGGKLNPFLLIAICFSVSSRPGYGQEMPPAPPNPAVRPDERFPDIYVNDSFEAADAIAEAHRLGLRGRWTQAARRLQDASLKAEDRLVPIAPGLYVGAPEHINRIIASWPREGLEAYRGLFESELRSLLHAREEDREPADWLRLFERYFCTASAAELADTIGQRAIESGDLALAERVYRQVLEEHPDRATYARRYQAMLAIIAAMEGKPASAQPFHDVEAAVRWKGQDRPVREVIREIRQGFEELRSSRSPADWPMFGGGAARNQRNPTDVDDLGLLWRFQFSHKASDDTPSRPTGRGEKSRYLAMNPVVANGLVFVQRFREVVAIHRNTGVTAWRFRADQGTPSTDGYVDEQPPGWDAVTIHRRRVYVALPGDTVPYYSYESARSPPELACLDAITGQVIWRSSGEQVEDDFAEITFDSSPIIRLGKLYIVGRRRRSFGFEDCYLFRFDAMTGALEYRTHLGSGSVAATGTRRSTTSIAAAYGSTAYVCTNLGSVAAVSLHTGHVRWLRLYERRRKSGEESTGASTRDLRPWQFNPVIVDADRVIALPTDASTILVLNAQDGKTLHAIPLKKVDALATLYGVKGNLLCGVGRKVVCYDLETDELKWSTPLPEGSAIYGRGVWAGSRLMVPTTDRLLIVDVETGKSSDLPWGPEGTGGNLLALPDQLLVTGVDNVDSYVRRSQIWSNLRSRMDDAPDDPSPALEFAEIVLSNGEYDEAVDILREAFRRASRREAPLERSLRRRLYDDALTFAQRFLDRSMLTGDLADELYRYASSYPPNRQAHLTYRLRFADFFESIGLSQRAVRLFQQILRDRSLRELPTHETQENTDPAGITAQNGIAALIAKHGRDVYAPFESEAQALLTSGVTHERLQDLKRVVRNFPNSRAASHALIAHGRVLKRRGKLLAAARLFERAYHRDDKATDRPALLRRIADAYEQAGQEEYAYLWLTKAAREHPGYRFEDHGHRVSFREYRQRLDRVRALVESSVPDISLPLTPSFVHTFKKGVTLMAPRFGEVPGTDRSKFFAYTPEGLLAFDARSGRRLWEKAVAAGGKPQWLLADKTQAVFATESEVFALNAGTRVRRWTYGAPEDNKEREVVDWEDIDAIRDFAYQRGRLLIRRDSGRLSLITTGDGHLVWSKTYADKPAGPISLFGEWAMYIHHNTQQHIVIHLLDADTGERKHRIITREQASVQAVYKTLQGQLILVTSRSILAYDPETHRRQWRLPLKRDLREEVLLFDIDAVYFSEDGRRIRKVSLNDGRQLWESEPIAHRHDDLSIALIDANLIVATDSGVLAVDAVSGLTLWEGTAPEGARFAARLLTRAYVLALDVRKNQAETPGVAYFYDHRNASGVIPEKGGALSLGPLEDLRTVQAFDDALVIQTDNTIRGWSHEATP